MAVLNAGGVTSKRRPALKGALMQDVSNGKERSRKWPRSRGKATKAKTAEQNEQFRQMSWGAKYWDPKIIELIMKARAGTPILPRDLQFMFMSNTVYGIIRPNGWKVYPVAVQEVVSDSLDAIGQYDGAIMVRTPQGWRVVVADAPDQVLLAGPDLIPAFTPVAGLNTRQYEKDRHIPSTGDFTIVNNGAGAAALLVSSTPYGVRFECPTAGSNIRLLRGAVVAPTLDFTATARMETLYMFSGTASYSQALILYSATTNRCLIWGQYQGGFLIQQWSGFTAFNANISGPSQSVTFAQNPWRRIRRVGPVILFEGSPDGEAWGELNRTNVATWIGAPTAVGVGAMVNGNKTIDIVQSWEFGP